MTGPESRARVLATYNPDMQKMTVKFGYELAMNIEKMKLDRDAKKVEPTYNYYEHVIVTKHINDKKKEYEAGNKFGAKIIVTEYTGWDYGIALIGVNQGINPQPKLETNFNISPEEGRDLKANLGVLLICKVKLGGNPPAYTLNSAIHIEPTMDSPTELHLSSYS